MKLVPILVSILSIFLSWPGIAVGEVLSDKQIKSHSTELVELISRGDVGSAVAEMERLLDENVRTATNSLAAGSVLEQLFITAGNRYEEPLNKWYQENPKSVTGFVFLAKFYQEFALQALHQRFAITTSTMAQELYDSRIERARSFVESALELNSDSVLANFMAIKMARAMNLSLESLLEVFNKVEKKDPYFMEAYIAVLVALVPKKGGSEWDFFKFARKHGNKEDSKAPFPYLIPAAHDMLCHLYGGKAAYYSNQRVWNEVRNSFDLLITRFPKNAYFYARYAEDAYQANQVEIATKLLLKAKDLDSKHTLVKKLLEKHPTVEQS